MKEIKKIKENFNGNKNYFEVIFEDGDYNVFFKENVFSKRNRITRLILKEIKKNYPEYLI